MTPPTLSARALISVCYDGKVITTPWSPYDKWYLAAQQAHADQHRDKVLRYLNEKRLRRLIPVAA